MKPFKLRRRQAPDAAVKTLHDSGMPLLLAKLYAARGIVSPSEISYEFAGILPPLTLKNAAEAAVILSDAIEAGKRIVCSADFDCDGVGSAAIITRAFQLFGARKIDVAMPVRHRHGYGLSPLLVEEIQSRFSPDLIVTVDCGISSFEGIEAARKLGIPVLVTDHHMVSDKGLPDALCIVNPNQPGDTFAGKSLSGAGVIFYVMLAVRAELKSRGYFEKKGVAYPNLAEIVDLVAMSTVADVVSLKDQTNRILVNQGLKRVREGRACHGIMALMKVAGRFPPRASVYDIGFAVGPRLNSSGRLDDMTVGLQCLLANDEQTAMSIAIQLDALNVERREIEAAMTEEAEAMLAEVNVSEGYSLVISDAGFHAGVIGILASRLKEKHERPTIVFAPGDNGVLKGSGRSIPGLNLRDALDIVDKQNEGLLLAFGGHAMAAGMSIPANRFADFKAAFERVVRGLLGDADLNQVTETDGDVSNADITVDMVKKLEEAVWGQGFPQPLFDSEVNILEQKILKDAHLKMKIEKGGKIFDAIWFFQNQTIPSRNRLVYSLSINEFNGKSSVQMLVRAAEHV